MRRQCEAQQRLSIKVVAAIDADLVISDKVGHEQKEHALTKLFSNALSETVLEEEKDIIIKHNRRTFEDSCQTWKGRK